MVMTFSFELITFDVDYNDEYLKISLKFFIHNISKISFCDSIFKMKNKM